MSLPGTWDARDRPLKNACSAKVDVSRSLGESTSRHTGQCYLRRYRPGISQMLFHYFRWKRGPSGPRNPRTLRAGPLGPWFGSMTYETAFKVPDREIG